MRNEEDDNSHEVWEHNHIFKLTCQPYQVQRVLVYADLVRQTCRIVAAQPRAAIGIDTDAEVPNSCFQLCSPDNGGDCTMDAEVRLCGRWLGWVAGVVEGYEEDIRYDG